MWSLVILNGWSNHQCRVVTHTDVPRTNLSTCNVPEQFDVGGKARKGLNNASYSKGSVLISTAPGATADPAGGQI